MYQCKIQFAIKVDVWQRRVGISEVDLLASQIRKALSLAASCTIFRPDIARVWPQIIDMAVQRDAAIQGFARQHGWVATIVDPGITVTFRRDSQQTDLGPAEKTQASLL
jgi:hypothetical protein